MPRRSAARVLTTAVVVVLLFLVGAPAGAAPLTRDTVPFFSLDCTDLSGPAGSANLVAGQQGFEEWGSLVVWAPGSDPDAEPPALESVGFTLGSAGNVITGALLMKDAATGEDVGAASFHAELRPLGAPVLGDRVPTRFGNIVDRGYRSEQEAAVSGLLELADGEQFDLAGCTATVGEVVIVHNTPRMVVEHLPGQTFGVCLAAGVDGHTLALLLIVEHDETFAEVAVLPPDGDEPVAFGFDAVTLGRTSLTGTVALIDAAGEPAGEALIAATVEAQRPRIVKGTEGDIHHKTFFRDFAVGGEVTVNGFGIFHLEGACHAGYERGLLRYPNPEA